MEKKEYERINALLHTHVNPPTDKDIKHTIEIIESRMVGKDESTSVFRGYLAALDILQKRPSKHKLMDIQAKAIEEIARDYLKGDCTQDILAKIPLPERNK